MVQLSRRISPFTLFLLSINAIIGSGWLFAPMYAAKIAGPAALVSWLIGGVAAILIALTFAELSTMLPIAGGSAHIPQLSHGPFVSFVLSWIAWITTLMLAPIEVQAVLQYASLFFPALIIPHKTEIILSPLGYSCAALLMIALSAVNILSYKGLMRSNFILCMFKFSVILLTIFAILSARFYSANFTDFSAIVSQPEGWRSIFSAVATAGIVLAFNGFKSGVEMAGEAKNLSIAIPVSTVGAVLACLLLYLGLQICFIGALPPEVIQQGWQKLNFVGDIGPFVGLAATLGLFWLLKLLYLNAMISPLGAGLIYVTASARILYAMSRLGYVPKVFSKLNRQHFPVWAILLNFFLGMLSFLPLPGWQAMVNFLVSAMVITYAMGPIAVLTLRKTMSQQNRPFRVPMANALCVLAFYSCNLFSYWTGWQTISKFAITLLVGAALFIVAYLRGNVKMTRKDILSGHWILIYLGGLILISYLGAFGGKGIIPFGWDFLVIAAFSVIIMVLALNHRAVIVYEKNSFLLAEEKKF